MKNVIEFYNTTPRLAALSGLVVITSLSFLVKGVIDAKAASSKFDEYHCKMVLKNHTVDSPGRTLRAWVPDKYDLESQYDCPLSPAVCAESCHDLGMANLVVIITFVGLSLSLASPWLQEGKKKVTNKLLELGFLSKNPEQIPLATVSQQYTSSGTFGPSEKV